MIEAYETLRNGRSMNEYNVLIRDIESTCPHCGKTNKSYFDHNRARIGILNEQPVVAVDCSKCHKHYVYRVMAFEPKLQYYAPTAAPNIEQIRKNKKVLSSLPDKWGTLLDDYIAYNFISNAGRVTMAKIFWDAFSISAYSHQDSMKVGKFMKNRGWRRTRRLIGDKRKYEYLR